MTKLRGEQDINGDVARDLRIAANMSQRDFWQAIGVSQAAGCKCENDAHRRITKPTRILMYARYVAGLHLDASTPEGVKEMARLVKLQRKA